MLNSEQSVPHSDSQGFSLSFVQKAGELHLPKDLLVLEGPEARSFLLFQVRHDSLGTFLRRHRVSSIICPTYYEVRLRSMFVLTPNG